jgi:outer membrane immunogenic protein
MFRSVSFLLLAAALALAGKPNSAIADPYFDWAGPYMGADAGFDWAKSQFQWSSAFTSAGPINLPYNGPGAFSYSPNGFTGDLHAGYNFQSGMWVGGVEGAVGYLSFGGSVADPTKNGVKDTFASTDGGVYGALTAKVGVAADRFLLYGKAGVAVFGGESHIDDNCSTDGCGPAVIHASDSGARFGWTGGVGLGYALSRHLSARLEYDYYDFGSTNVTGTTNFGVTNTWRNVLSAQSLGLGLDYRF